MTQSFFLSRASRLFRLGLTVLVIAILAFAFPVAAVQAYSGYPTFEIDKVEKDTSVTIVTKNLPANQTFTVRMNKIGTRGVGGDVVGTFNSESGGVKTLSFDIPASLKGLKLIAIRFDSPQGYYAYNWFTNDPTGGDSGGIPSDPPHSGIPTFSIVKVVEDDEVTIKTSNFPAGKTFTVRMGNYGTKGIGGEVVGTTDSGTGGSFEATYKIPDSQKGKNRIAIRMDADSGGFFAYNWFYNTPSDGTVTPGKPYVGIPTFSIMAVVRDNTVTVKAVNFPADQTFTVRMGAYGTKGVGGISVGTKESGEGGSFEATYDIPESLKGSQRIAIRMESTQGYYAFNWFWNNTYP